MRLIIFGIIFGRICAEWEIPDEFRAPQILTTIKNGIHSAVYFIENGQEAEMAHQQWLSQILLEFADKNKASKMATVSQGEAYGNGKAQKQQQHTVSSNLRTIIDAMNGKKNGILADGCEVILHSSERMEFEIGTANITIGCTASVPNSSSDPLPNAYFCKNGTECQRAKIKWSNCDIIVLPTEEGNWTEKSEESAKFQFSCNDSLAPIRFHLRPFAEKMPDLRANYYQKRGRFHCPSEVTCLYEMFFNANSDGQNAIEMTNLAINFVIFVFLLFLNKCKIKLGH